MGRKDQSQDKKKLKEQPKRTPSSRHDEAWERTAQGDELVRSTDEMMREAEDKFRQDYRDD